MTKTKSLTLTNRLTLTQTQTLATIRCVAAAGAFLLGAAASLQAAPPATRTLTLSLAGQPRLVASPASRLFSSVSSSELFFAPLPSKPTPAGAYVSSNGTGAAGTWTALTGSGGSGPLPTVPQMIVGLYYSNDGTGAAGTWVPCTATCGSGGGGGSGTVNTGTGNQGVRYIGSGTTVGPDPCTSSDAATWTLTCQLQHTINAPGTMGTWKNTNGGGIIGYSMDNASTTQGIFGYNSGYTGAFTQAQNTLFFLGNSHPICFTTTVSNTGTCDLSVGTTGSVNLRVSVTSPGFLNATNPSTPAVYFATKQAGADNYFSYDATGSNTDAFRGFNAELYNVTGTTGFLKPLYRAHIDGSNTTSSVLSLVGFASGAHATNSVGAMTIADGTASYGNYVYGDGTANYAGQQGEGDYTLTSVVSNGGKCQFTVSTAANVTVGAQIATPVTTGIPAGCVAAVGTPATIQSIDSANSNKFTTTQTFSGTAFSAGGTLRHIVSTVAVQSLDYGNGQFINYLQTVGTKTDLIDLNWGVGGTGTCTNALGVLQNYTPLLYIGCDGSITSTKTVSAAQFVPSGSAPTMAPGTAAGTSPTCTSVTGTNVSGVITCTTGTATTAGTLATITFNGTLASAPRGCQLTPRTAVTTPSATSIYTTTPSTGSWTIGAAVGLTASTAYSWSYLCL